MFYDISSTDYKGSYFDHYRLFSLLPSMYLFSTQKESIWLNWIMYTCKANR